MPIPLSDYHDIFDVPENPLHKKVDPLFDFMIKNDFKQVLKNMNNISDQDMHKLIADNLDQIIKAIESNDFEYRDPFTNSRFLKLFIHVVTYTPISIELRLCCNRLSYDFFTSTIKNNVLNDLYLQLGRIVNSKTIDSLVGIGLNEELATHLAICRFSSADEQVSSKRLNFVICNQDPDIMSEQIVIWIYEKLYTHITSLFLAIMFEVYTPKQQLELGEEFMDVYGIISLSILDILNNMTSIDIRTILITYAQEWQHKKRPEVRISLRALSADYSRVADLVEFINSQGTYYIF